MYVEIIESYNDTEKDRKIKLGDTFEVDDKRGRQLISSKVAKRIEEPPFRLRKSKYNTEETHGTEQSDS